MAGGKAFTQADGGYFYDQTSFGTFNAVGVAISILVSNIPVMVITHVLMGIFREQGIIKSYVRARADA